MSKNGERQPLLNGGPACNGINSRIIDVTSITSSDTDLTITTSITSSGQYRKKEAAQLLNHAEQEESIRLDDLDDTWHVVSMKNARKRQENATRCVCVCLCVCVCVCVCVCRPAKSHAF